MSISSLYPSISPSLILDFANSKVLDSRVTFTRTTTATYYDGVTTAKAEENLVLYSQEFNQSAWGKTLGSITANADTAPDGTATADLFTPSDPASRVQQSFNPIGAVQYVFTVYLRSATGSSFSTDLIAWRDSPFNQTAITTITVTTTWQRFTLTFTALDTTTHSVVIGGGGSLSTGENIYLWGAQLEQRSSATAYTATTSQAITNYIPVLQTAAAGQARFDHNPTTGESLGLLIEEARTNLVVYSSDFANANWIQYNGGVITSNQMIAPDGTLTADQMVMTSTQYSGVYQSGPAGATGTCTISVWARTATGTQTFNIGFYNGIQGAVMSPNLTATTSWQRFTFTATLSGVSNIHINNYTASAGTIFIWGAQVEAGSFATSYIPTVASSVTRNADVASMTGTNFSSWFNNSEGTLFANFKTSVATNYPQAAFISDGTSNNCINIDAQSGLRSIVTTLGATTAFFSASKSGSGDLVTLAYKVNDFGSSFNGAAAGTDTSGNVPVVSQFGIGQSYSNLNLLNGTIKKISYYPIKATSAQLQALTV